jgi:hypothetical protein
MGSKHKKKKHRETTKEARKRKFAYRSLKDVDCPKVYDDEFDREAYEYFKSVKWDAAWKEFLVKEKDGRYKYQTVWSLCKELAEKDTEGAKIIYAAIGPADKKARKKIVPYLGDWGLNRASFMIGEVNKESLLYSNPKIQTLRELVKKHLDVMEISQGLGELLMGWVGRYDAWATQVDEYFKYKLFDPKVNDEKNEKRFAKYTKMQEYIFSRTIDSVRQVLRCFGVGENDVALLTQMMIAAMRERLGGDAARIMMASATGVKIIDGQVGQSLEASGDSTVIDGTNKAFTDNPHLKLLMGTFVTKSQVYSMPHPDIALEGVQEADERTDPKLDPPKVKTNGKSHTNGKQTMKQ